MYYERGRDGLLTSIWGHKLRVFYISDDAKAYSKHGASHLLRWFVQFNGALNKRQPDQHPLHARS